MKTVLALLLSFAMLSIPACSSESSGPSGGDSSSSSSSSCSKSSVCINGSCKCLAGPNKDASCCDESKSDTCGSDACGTVCYYCE
ncbi:MAG: hypothetical protein KBF88_04020 [Polyangiaceae bacterium]|nr:hypothetical protein [Polyangiaceae bacterium]